MPRAIDRPASRPVAGLGVVVVAAAPVRVGSDRADLHEHSAISSAVAGAPHGDDDRARDAVAGSRPPTRARACRPSSRRRPRAHRSMPSASASAASTSTWSRIVIDREARPVRPCRRRVDRRRARSCPGTRRARSGTRRRTGRCRSRGPGPIDAVPPADVAVPGPGRPGRVAVAGERVQHEHRVRRVGRERRPTSRTRRSTGSSAPAGLERERPSSNSVTNCRRPGSVARPPRARDRERHRVGHGRRVTRLRGAEPGVEVGEDVVEGLDADRQAHEVRA